MAKKQKPLLDPIKFGLAGGILGGLIVFIMTLISAANGYGRIFLALCVDIYPGYTITYLGSLLGLVYGFIDGFVGLFVLIWLYNWLCK